MEHASPERSLTHHECVAQPITSYRDLIVWRRAVDLAISVYALTEHFPRTEQFGLTAQMRRAAVSIASNIAEGRHRGSRRDFVHFLHIARGSGAELETQITIAMNLAHTKRNDFGETLKYLSETMRMLHVMIQKLKAIS
jgi:four helix bundle protein